MTELNINIYVEHFVISNLSATLTEVYRSHSFVYHVKECSCDSSALSSEQEKEEREREKLANQQILKNMEAKNVLKLAN